MEEVMKHLQRIERLLVIGNKEVLDTSELALYMNISESRLRTLTSERKIPHYKSESGRVSFKKSEIDQWRLGYRVKTHDEVEEEAKQYCARKKLERI